MKVSTKQKMAKNEKSEIAAKIETAKEFKAQGTKLLNEGNYKAANDKYQMIIDVLESDKVIEQYEAEKLALVQVINFSLAIKVNVDVWIFGAV